MLKDIPAPKKRPNRIFEIFVVFGIMAVTVMVLVEVLGSTRTRTENITTISQMREYRQALNVFFLEKGYYPNKDGQANGSVCLGDYADDDCWGKGISIKEDMDVLGNLVPNFLSAIPVGSEKKYGVENDAYYVGAIYQYTASGQAYIIKYFLSGKDQSCGLDNAVGANVGKDTLCILSVSI